MCDREKPTRPLKQCIACGKTLDLNMARHFRRNHSTTFMGKTYFTPEKTVDKLPCNLLPTIEILSHWKNVDWKWVGIQSPARNASKQEESMKEINKSSVHQCEKNEPDTRTCSGSYKDACSEEIMPITTDCSLYDYDYEYYLNVDQF